MSNWESLQPKKNEKKLGFDLGMQLQEVGDFGDENCLPPLNLIRSTKLHLTNEPPIFCRCCYRQHSLYQFFQGLISIFVPSSIAL